MSNYPPGMSYSDLERAGIIQQEICCPECDEIIHGVESHADECPEPLGQEELAERLHERQAPEYDPVEHKNL